MLGDSQYNYSCCRCLLLLSCASFPISSVINIQYHRKQKRSHRIVLARECGDPRMENLRDPPVTFYSVYSLFIPPCFAFLFCDSLCLSVPSSMFHVTLPPGYSEGIVLPPCFVDLFTAGLGLTMGVASSIPHLAPVQIPLQMPSVR